MYPRSEIPPSIETSVNKNVDIRTCNPIAIVQLTNHSREVSEAELEMAGISEEHSDKYIRAAKQALRDELTYRQKALEAVIYDAYESQFLNYGFDVVERNKIEKVLEELGLSMTGLISEEAAVKTGKLVGAKSICLIDMITVDGKSDPTIAFYQESFKVIKVETGQIAFKGMGTNMIGARDKMFMEVMGKILNQANYPLK